MRARTVALAAGLVLGGLVVGVVFLWPGPGTGPEPLRYGRDTCSHCRMQLTQPGFAAEMRDHDGALTKYDDVGCLLRAILAVHREVPEAWVEDHASGGFVPLLDAYLVREEGSSTPMGYGIVAFKEDSAARAHAAAHTGKVLAFEDVLHDPAIMARVPASAPTGREGTP
ncbi:MAG: nitrous oxide reductase accessory protein NosL [Candidatus Binatia bacterium]